MSRNKIQTGTEAKRYKIEISRQTSFLLKKKGLDSFVDLDGRPILEKLMLLDSESLASVQARKICVEKDFASVMPGDEQANAKGEDDHD